MENSRNSSRLDRDGVNSGSAWASAHHGELIQGVFEDEEGHLRRALITLPLRTMHSLAIFQPRQTPGIQVDPSDRIKAGRAAQITLQRLKIGTSGGSLTLRSEIPIGHGYGSSSADVIAAIRAVLKSCGRVAWPTITSEIAVAAEAASDAIAFEDSAVLFAHREGKVLEYLGGNLPPWAVVSFKAAGATPISTTALSRAHYNAEEIEVFRCALAAVRRAVQSQDPRLLGQAASLSSWISQRHLPKSGFETAVEIVKSSSAVGLQVSHSGSLMGVLVDATTLRLEERLSSIAAKVRQAGFMDVEQYVFDAEAARP